jgi:predicted O-methyltransferase YrrM
MRKLSNVLAVYGAAVALIGVINAYLIKSYWNYLFDWHLVTDQTHLAVTLGLLLIVLAFFARSMTWNTQSGSVKAFILAVGVLVIISGFTLCRTFIKISRSLQSDKATFQTRYGFFTTPVAKGENMKYDFATDYVTPHAANWAKYLEQIKDRPARGLEIGSFEGRSALWFLENILTHPDSTITCVDIFESDYEKFFDKNIAISGFQSKVRKLKGDSRYMLRGLEPKVFDFAYIDGSHVAMDVLTDAVLVWDLIKPGGIIIFDDYDWPGGKNNLEGPAKLAKIAVDAFLTVYAPYIDVVHRDYQIIVKKRTSVDLDSQKHPLTTRAWRILFW